jgi:hypothetical protein
VELASLACALSLSLTGTINQARRTSPASLTLTCAAATRGSLPGNGSLVTLSGILVSSTVCDYSCGSWRQFLDNADPYRATADQQ